MTNDMDDACVLLEEAVKLVERGWAQGTRAIDEKGINCSPRSESASAWCALGAIEAALPLVSEDSYCRRRAFKCAWEVLHQAIWENFQICTSITAWNDGIGRQQSEVLALFGDTIKRLRTHDKGEAA